MGLLDSVLGAVMGGQQAQGAGQGGIGNIIAMVGNNPQLLQAVTGMLGNDGEHGGLGGLIGRFEQAGLGHVVSSWIGKGENLPVSGEQMAQVLGTDTVAALARKVGLSADDLPGQLSQILPGLVDQLTPHGESPAAGLGNAGDLMGMLGGLLRR